MAAAAAMFKKGLDENKIRALGLTPEDFPDDVVEIWPANWQSCIVFAAMATQWRVGHQGPYALDFGVLPEIWRRTKTPIIDRDGIFYDLQVMQEAALDEMRK